MFKRRNRNTKPLARRLGIEALESRATPVANVLASLSNGVLTLNSATLGGNEAVRLRMVGPASDHRIILDDPSFSTFFNGGSNWTTPTGQPVTAIHINLKGGNDQVDINGVQLAGGIVVNVGDGQNAVSVFNGTHVGSLKIIGGVGDDAVGLFNNVTVDHDTSIALGNGANAAYLHFNVNVGGKLAINAGYGDDKVELGQLEVVGTTSINLGAGNNALTNDSSDAGLTKFDSAFKATFGAEQDTFALAPNTKFGAGLTAQLGAGVNTATLYAFNVAGSVNIKGGADEDDVHLADLKIDGSVTVGLGAGDNLLALDDVSESLFVDPSNQIVSNVGSVIHGNLKVTSTGIGERIEIGDEQPVHIFGTTAITTGAGGALINIDDTTFDGAVAINTGAGFDQIDIDLKSTLHGFTHFHSLLTIHAGTGIDALFLGDNQTADSTVYFDVKPLLDGGADTDAFHGLDYDFKGANTPLDPMSW
ncbi:MAG TPA: hypothetical protein VHR66_13945 [Gemmataceae bacterium]|jgi:hypothetical protein|nr:hypothetical protein [Gemmataceae bacterium]